MLTKTKTAFAEPTKTDGVSPKTILAGLLPALGTVLAVVVQWAITGDFNKPELATAVTGLLSAGIAALGAYVASPGVVTVPVNVGTPNDELLLEDPDVKKHLKP